MNPAGLKRRSDSVQQLLGSGFLRVLDLLLANSKEAVAHAHIEFSRTRYFQREVVKFALAAFRIERRFVRTITDQIVTALVIQDALNASAEIIRIPNRESPGLLREIIQTILGFIERVATNRQLLVYLRGASAESETIRGARCIAHHLWIVLRLQPQ